MANLKDLLSDHDPELMKQSLDLLAAFREIKDANMRQAVTELARAMRPAEGRENPSSPDIPQGPPDI